MKKSPVKVYLLVDMQPAVSNFPSWAYPEFNSSLYFHYIIDGVYLNTVKLYGQQFREFSSVGFVDFFLVSKLDHWTCTNNSVS
jgi:hypothetical protein